MRLVIRDFQHFRLKYYISTCDRKFLTVTGNESLGKEISSCHMKFLPETEKFFLGQEISAIFHCFDIRLPQKYTIFWHISKSQQKCVIFLQNFAWEFRLPGKFLPLCCYLFLAICHLLSLIWYLLLVICYLLSDALYLKLASTCKNFLSFVVVCLVI